jgi:hypothetical protein
MAKASEYMDIMRRNLAEKEQELAQLEIKLGRVKAEVDLLQNMIAEATGQPSPSAKPRARRSNVKKMVLSLLQEVGSEGLNAAIAVELASEKNVDLERATVSSLLSRLKTDGIVLHDGERYRLKELEKTTQTDTGWPSDNVHPHPASRSAP